MPIFMTSQEPFLICRHCIFDKVLTGFGVISYDLIRCLQSIEFYSLVDVVSVAIVDFLFILFFLNNTFLLVIEITKEQILQRQSTFVKFHTSNPLSKNSFLIWVVGSLLLFFLYFIL